MSLPAFMTDHLLHERPEKPQNYWQHGRFAMKHSLTLLVAGAAGVIHAIFPWWFKFYTAEKVVQVYTQIDRSGRHEELLRDYGLR